MSNCKNIFPATHPLIISARTDNHHRRRLFLFREVCPVSDETGHNHTLLKLDTVGQTASKTLKLTPEDIPALRKAPGHAVKAE
jgi:hypothetical protein